MLKKMAAWCIQLVTLNKKENEKQIEYFIKNHPGFALEKEETLFPNEYSGGFFIAKLVRNTH